MDDLAGLTRARSMLMILLAACQQTLLALEANVLDTDLTQDLAAMIDRTENELVLLTARIDALAG